MKLDWLQGIFLPERITPELSFRWYWRACGRVVNASACKTDRGRFDSGHALQCNLKVYVERSSIGRAPDCESGPYRFDPDRSTQIGRAGIEAVPRPSKPMRRVRVPCPAPALVLLQPTNG